MIGVFDSGYGGLSIFREIVRELPAYDFIYFGDNARAPYGDRSQEVIYRYTKEACEWLFSQGCGLIVLACNTASAQALRRLQQEYLPSSYPARRILGVLVPITEAVSQQVSPGDTIGIIATRATVTSGAFVRELRKYIPENIEIIQKACPLLVPLVEEGWLDHPVTHEVVREYLAPLKGRNLTTLILGCTHYPFLYELIQQEMGQDCYIPDPGRVVAASLRDYLKRHAEIESKLSKHGLRRYITTDQPERFLDFASLTKIGFTLEPERIIVS